MLSSRGASIIGANLFLKTRSLIKCVHAHFKEICDLCHFRATCFGFLSCLCAFEQPVATVTPFVRLPLSRESGAKAKEALSRKHRGRPWQVARRQHVGCSTRSRSRRSATNHQRHEIKNLAAAYLRTALIVDAPFGEWKKHASGETLPAGAALTQEINKKKPTKIKPTVRQTGLKV